MTRAKAGIFAFFFLAAGCSGKTVPNPDEIEALVNSGDYRAAEIVIKEAVKADPANLRLAFLHGRVALETGNHERAKAELTRAMRDPALGAKAKLLLAKAQLLSGQGAEALRLIGPPPYESEIAHVVAAGANLAANRFDKTDALLKDGLAAYPKSADLLVLAGNRALQEGDVAKARELVDTALRHDPDDVAALLFSARTALIARQMDRAEQQFDAVLKLRPADPTALFGKVAIAYDRGDRKQTQAMLDAAVKGLGESALPVGYMRAQLAFDDGKVEEANRILLSLGEVGSFPPAVMLTGLVAVKRGQAEQAIIALRRFLTDGGEDGRARLALAQAYMQAGDRKAAWKTLQPLADAANATAPVLALAAQLVADLGLPAEGYRTRRDAAARPNPIGRQLAQADAAIRKGDWKGADGLYKAVLRARPGSTDVILLNNAAMVRTELGDPAGAIVLARRALAAAPNDPVVLDTLAWALFRADGASPEAVALMKRAIQAMPGNPEIRQHALAIQAALAERR